jgi:hypothetical protein
MLLSKSFTAEARRHGELQIENNKDFLRASASQRLNSNYCESIKTDRPLIAPVQPSRF